MILGTITMTMRRLHLGCAHAMKGTKWLILTVHVNVALHLHFASQKSLCASTLPSERIGCKGVGRGCRADTLGHACTVAHFAHFAHFEHYKLCILCRVLHNFPNLHTFQSPMRTPSPVQQTPAHSWVTRCQTEDSNLGQTDPS